MSVRTLALVTLIAATVGSTGCNLRGKSPAGDEPTLAPDQSAEITALRSEVETYKGKYAQAQAALDAKAGGTIGDDAGISGPAIEGLEPTANGGVALPDDFAFAKGSADLNEEGKKTIGKLAQRLNEGSNAGKQVIVEGHTDHSPVSRAVTKEKFTDNWGLSGARAAAVVRALEAAGVNPKRLHGAFRSEFQPRVTVPEGDSKGGKAVKSHDGDGEAANRRVEIYLGK